MRVITGTARGRRLETLEGEDVRPTTDRIKEAVFSIIQFETEGRIFLDLFAGSGQMGIEALSRGAKQAYFADSAKKSIETVKRNLKATGFLDPPYRTGMLQEALTLTAPHMRETGVMIAENPLEEPLEERYGDFVRDRQYRYGKIRITTFRHKDYML